MDLIYLCYFCSEKLPYLSGCSKFWLPKENRARWEAKIEWTHYSSLAWNLATPSFSGLPSLMRPIEQLVFYFVLFILFLAIVVYWSVLSISFVFQAGLTQESLSVDGLQEYASIVISKNIESIYACGGWFLHYVFLLFEGSCTYYIARIPLICIRILS